MNPDLFDSLQYGVDSSVMNYLEDEDKEFLEMMTDGDTWKVILERLGRSKRNHCDELDWEEGEYAVCRDASGLDFLMEGEAYEFDRSSDDDLISVLVNGDYHEVFKERFEIVSV